MQRQSARQPARRATCPVHTIAVLIATYRRSADLLRCLGSLAQQTLSPDQVIVVCRVGDAETLAALEQSKFSTLPTQIIQVSEPGTVAARNAGLEALTSDVVVMLDDDTVALPAFLATVLAHFQADPTLGGLGGRDRCFGSGHFDDRQEAEVGKLLWYGKMIGNHHLGFGDARPVDLLKGANMSFRREAILQVRFDPTLKGTGAQPSEDLCFSLTVKSLGWKLLYDPAALVHHFAGQREEDRLYVGVAAVSDYKRFEEFAFNQVVATWVLLSSWQRAAFLFWSMLIGTGVFPGLVQAIRFTPRLGKDSWRRFFAAQRGRMEAFRSLLTQRAAPLHKLGG